MAKNCFTCALPISSEQSFKTCKSCNNCFVHNSCIKATDNVEDCDATSKHWKCTTCCAKDFSQNSVSSNAGNSYVAKLGDLLSRITKLQDEQKNIVNSMLNELNDTMGNYEETINNVTVMLTSLQSQLDDFTNEQIDTTSQDVTRKHEEQNSPRKQ